LCLSVQKKFILDAELLPSELARIVILLSSASLRLLRVVMPRRRHPPPLRPSIPQSRHLPPSLRRQTASCSPPSLRRRWQLVHGWAKRQPKAAARAQRSRADARGGLLGGAADDSFLMAGCPFFLMAGGSSFQMDDDPFFLTVGGRGRPCSDGVPP
jgi:hypothetical protein